MVFRTTPQLGPQLDQVIPENGVWYDDTRGIVSPQVGTVESGSDGHDYIFVLNDTGGDLAASARFNIADDGSFGLTASGSGSFMVPAADTDGAADGATFWARRYAM